MRFTDATIMPETPPLRACWSLVGQPAEVPITGNRDKRVVFGALAPKTAAVWFDESAKWNQDAFQLHLQSRWRGWKVVLFVDECSPHTAKTSRAPARELGIELRFMPTACPEQKPVEGLCGPVKGRVIPNELTQSCLSASAVCTTGCSR
ncbi:transposase [Gemmata sp. JC717]|uniref:transposase n=1 Tax=Gemmata algarum TaxID=2975278 RepID=UPI0021BA8851|nr:transposase [Gemmata algarum]MDY3554881.1 transposase [Gemmata algarum]